MASELAKAYVQIIPSSEGLKGELEKIVGNEAESAGKSGGLKIGSGIAKGIGLAGAAIGAASGAIGMLGKQAIEAYADFEQLTGGIETLFGNQYKTVEEYAKGEGLTLKQAEDNWAAYQTRQNYVLTRADMAYKTAGLSANEYMETVTSFAASLNASLGENAAYSGQYADMAITDMADNANKMGSSMESIQNAYQGFAKQNYNMLDNLKLGYGGTQEEMYRLLSDAASLNEEFAKTSDFSLDDKGHLKAGFADIVKAIHIVQEEMGITGTTAKEASSTISGSIASMKSAWANLITGIADDNSNFDALISNLVESVGIAFDNILPRISVALNGVGSLITKLAPIIIEKLPELAATILPQLLQSATSLIISFSAVIPELLGILLQTIVMNLPSLISGIADGLSAIFPQLEEVFKGLADMMNGLFGWILENGDTIIFLVSTILGGFLAYKTVTGIFQTLEMAQKAAAVAQGILNAVMSANPIGLIVVSIGALVGAFIALWNTSAEFREFWYQTWENIKSAFETVWNTLGNFFTVTIPNTINSAVQFFVDLKNKATETVQQAVTNFANFFSQLPSKIATTVLNAINKIIDFKNRFITNAKEAASGFFNGIISGLASLPGKMWDIGSNIVQGIKNGISNAWNSMVSWFKGLFGDLVQIAKDILGIASPSKVFKQIGEYTTEGFDDGMKDFGAGAIQDVQSAMDEISGMSATVDAIGVSAKMSTDPSLATPGTSADTSSIEALLLRYLPMLENGTNVNVSLQGDAQGLFRTVRKEVNQFTKSTGNSPFIAPA